MVKFLGKYPREKYVRIISNKNTSHTVQHTDNNDKIKENNNSKIEKDMADERLEKIEQIIGTKAPKRKVKYEKKDKGLIERTESSTILLTEDNKMLLND